MYCPVCGAESSQAGKYCKRCGANLAQTAGSAETVNVPIKLTGMFLLALTLVTITGLGIAMAVPSELAYKNYPDGLVGMIVVLAILMAIGIDLLLVWLLLHLIKLSHKGFAPERPNVAFPVAHPKPQLDAPMAGVLSVTEHTTRNFEPVSDGESVEQDRSIKQRATK